MQFPITKKKIDCNIRGNLDHLKGFKLHYLHNQPGLVPIPKEVAHQRKKPATACRKDIG